MLAANLVWRCSCIDTITLESLLRKAYPKDSVLRSEFVGITNGNQFCYKIVYPDQDAKNGMAVTKVFVWQDSNGDLVADY